MECKECKSFTQEIYIMEWTYVLYLSYVVYET